MRLHGGLWGGLEASNGGGEGIRTPDPLLAKQVLSRLSYTPISGLPFYHVPAPLFDIQPTSRYYIAHQIGPISRARFNLY